MCHLSSKKLFFNSKTEQARGKTESEREKCQRSEGKKRTCGVKGKIKAIKVE